MVIESGMEVSSCNKCENIWNGSLQNDHFVCGDNSGCRLMRLVFLPWYEPQGLAVNGKLIKT